MWVVALAPLLFGRQSICAVGHKVHCESFVASVMTQSTAGVPGRAMLGTTMESLGRAGSGIVVDQPPVLLDQTVSPEVAIG